MKGTADRVNAGGIMEAAIRAEKPVALVHAHTEGGGEPSHIDVELTLRQLDWLKATGTVGPKGTFHWMRAGAEWKRMDEGRRETLRRQLTEAQDGMPYPSRVEALKDLDGKGVVENETV